MKKNFRTILGLVLATIVFGGCSSKQEKINELVGLKRNWSELYSEFDEAHNIYKNINVKVSNLTVSGRNNNVLVKIRIENNNEGPSNVLDRIEGEVTVINKYGELIGHTYFDSEVNLRGGEFETLEGTFPINNYKISNSFSPDILKREFKDLTAYPKIEKIYVNGGTSVKESNIGTEWDRYEYGEMGYVVGGLVITNYAEIYENSLEHSDDIFKDIRNGDKVNLKDGLHLIDKALNNLR